MNCGSKNNQHSCSFFEISIAYSRGAPAILWLNVLGVSWTLYLNDRRVKHLHLYAVLKISK